MCSPQSASVAIARDLEGPGGCVSAEGSRWVSWVLASHRFYDITWLHDLREVLAFRMGMALTAVITLLGGKTWKCHMGTPLPSSLCKRWSQVTGTLSLLRPAPCQGQCGTRCVLVISLGKTGKLMVPLSPWAVTPWVQPVCLKSDILWKKKMCKELLVVSKVEFTWGLCWKKSMLVFLLLTLLPHLQHVWHVCHLLYTIGSLSLTQL